MTDGWAAESAGLRTYILSQSDISEKQAYHGKRCLHLLPGVKPFSRPIEISQEGKVTLSAYLKSARPCQINFSLKQEGERNPTVI
ncbi:MAG: hypothetical protein NC911_10220, partial [Candidatus Omnitrophica bacterium]|nr:hypothetical protein [Candidatus Omnitrophota bacterium]